jgi:plastocyanin
MRLAPIAIAAALAAPACSSRHAPVVHQVAIRGMQFVPPELTVAVGDVVVWTNQDYFPHTVTAAGAFDSKNIESQATWRYTADRAGTFPYVCTLHPTMKGTLIVR